MKTINLDDRKEALPIFYSKEKPNFFFGLWGKSDRSDLTVTIFYPDDFLLEKLGKEEYYKLRKALGLPYKDKEGRLMLNGEEIKPPKIEDIINANE